MAERKKYSAKQKENFSKKSDDRVNDFLADLGEKIKASIADEDFKYVWKRPVFEQKFMNPISGTSYNMLNTMLLAEQGQGRNYEHPLYISYAQGKAAGLDATGAKADYIEKKFGVKIGYLDDNGQKTMVPNDDPERQLWRPASKIEPIFNINQFSGDLPPKVRKHIEALKALKTPTPVEVDTVFKALLETMPTPIERQPGVTNHYSPSRDTVVINPSSSFKSTLHEFHTLAHEISHSYGHESRPATARESLAKYHEDLKYRSHEELVANLSAQNVMKHFDLNLDPTTRQALDDGFEKNHLTYDAGWARDEYKKNPNLIFDAAKEADKVSGKIIFEMEKNLVLKLENNPELQVSPWVKERLEKKAAQPESVEPVQSKPTGISVTAKNTKIKYN